MSGETEERQFLVFEDFGTGMSKRIVENYFLQIGRSFYTTQEYRRICAFQPIGKFGVGFLTAFSASDDIEVETFMPSHGSPLQFKLTGPTNYLLCEKGTRATSGTKITVRLNNQIPENFLTDLLTRTCRKVEIPIELDELGSTTIIDAEIPEDFTYKKPVVTQENTSFEVKSFDINTSKAKGQLYIFALVGKEGERWDQLSWARHDYPKTHRTLNALSFRVRIFLPRT